jgi:activator of 2-hydroxyglutaryl-CoA dehydratase
MAAKLKKSILLDCGTSYAKVQYMDTGRRRIVPARDILRNPDRYHVAAATGHNAGVKPDIRLNELVALAHGGLSLIEDKNFTLLDCGARDVKYVKVKSRKVRGMDWNTECGAFTGQVIELLSRYFDMDPSALPASSGRLPVVCGVLGMTAMFDRIAQGAPHEVAFAEFLRGIAFNCETLVGRPDVLYLSGGLCENRTFVNSFSCEVKPLGRFVLLNGLLHAIANPSS